MRFPARSRLGKHLDLDEFADPLNVIERNFDVEGIAASEKIRATYGRSRPLETERLEDARQLVEAFEAGFASDFDLLAVLAIPPRSGPL